MQAKKSKQANKRKGHEDLVEEMDYDLNDIPEGTVAIILASSQGGSL